MKAGQTVIYIDIRDAAELSGFSVKYLLYFPLTADVWQASGMGQRSPLAAQH